MRKRDGNGRFVKGDSGGPGRPTRTIEEDFAGLFSKELTPEIKMKILAKLFAKAKKGDFNSIRLVLAYGLGSPEQFTNIHHDGLPDIIVFDPHEPAVDN